MWESTEGGNILIHWKNTTFIYHKEFSKYMTVDGATSEGKGKEKRKEISK